MASTPDWLNQEFLETALRAGEEDDSISVTGYRLTTTGDNNSDGYMSTMYRLSIDMESQTGAGNRAVIVKVSPSGGEWQEVIRNSSLFPRETRMFAETLPKMSRMLKDVSPMIQPFSAKYYFSRTDAEDESLRAIVMEDLTPKAFRMADRTKGLDLDHCLLTLRTMARFHAASAMLHSIEPDSMELYVEPCFIESESIRRYMGNFFAGMVRSLAVQIESWPDFGNKYTQNINRFADNVMTVYKESMQRDETSFNVLTHSDLWVNNLLFKYCESTSRVVDVRLLDFQLPCFTSPAVDLIFFILTSATEDVRVNHTSELLEEYHRTLGDTLTSLGYNQTPPTLRWIHEELERKVSYVFFVAATDFPIFLAGPEGFSIPSVDKDGNQMTSNQNIMSNENYKNVMHRLLPRFEHHGVI